MKCSDFTTPVSVAVYARISFDETGQERGVTRQLEDARALAAARGWAVAEEYVDNDVSAYNGAVRDNYLRLMQDAEAKRFDRIVIWHPSRLWRRRSERIQDIERLARLRIGITCVRGPELDLTNAYGRSMAVIMGEFDSAESEIKSERIARASLQRAQEGRAHGRAPYGWRREYQMDPSGRIVGFVDVEDKHEADIVREIVDRLLAGDPLKRIADDLNARREPTPSRNADVQWIGRNLGKLAVRPTNAAIRIYKGEALGKGAWPAIVDSHKHDRVVALLADPSRRVQRDARRTHLLSHGIGECGICGGVLSGGHTRWTSRHADKRTSPNYVCVKKGHVARNEALVDELVGAVVIERLSRPDAASIFAEDDEAATEASERAQTIRARLDTAADQFADGAITGAQLARISAKLRPELEEAEEDLRRSRRPAVPDVVDELMVKDEAASVWQSMQVAAKRAVLRALGLRVIIMPKTEKGPTFDPRDVVFRWGRE